VTPPKITSVTEKQLSKMVKQLHRFKYFYAFSYRNIRFNELYMTQTFLYYFTGEWIYAVYCNWEICILLLFI